MPTVASHTRRLRVLTLLSAFLIKKTLNLESICSLLTPFSHHPDPSLMQERDFKRCSVPKIASGQSVNFLIKDLHKSNFFFFSALCVSLKCCFKLNKLLDRLPPPFLPLSSLCLYPLSPSLPLSFSSDQ